MTRLAPLMAALAAGNLALAGCTMGPDFQKPELPADAGYAPLPEKTTEAATENGQAQTYVEAKDIPDQWWALFQSPSLDAMVRQAVAGNPDIEAARAAVKVAHENATAQLGAYYPTLGAGASATRARTALGALSSTAATQSPVYNLYSVQVAASYMPDLWGLNSRTVESLRAQEENQHFQYQSAFLSLTSSVVVTAITEAALRGQIDGTQEIIRLERESLAVLNRKFELGDSAKVDVLAQEVALAQAEATLPPLKKQLDVARDQLTVLLGKFPNQQPSETFTLDAIHLPLELPVSLPSRLVEKRPDVGAASANLHAATAQVGIAIANRLPNITLSANMGSIAPYVSGAQGLFTPGMGFWSLSGDLAATLFDGFTLEHRQRAAEAGVEQAAAQYRSVVLAAFQNVADSLSALHHDADALAAAVAAEKAAAETLEITRHQLELGAIPYLTLVSAQQTELQARITLVQAEAGRLADTAALFQSLGGGWWNRPDSLADAQ
jgi:NodT family efflux transporter outer membrane factor (OMF) lipoprotein